MYRLTDRGKFIFEDSVTEQGKVVMENNTEESRFLTTFGKKIVPPTLVGASVQANNRIRITWTWSEQ